MTKRFILVFFSVLLVSLTAFGMAFASGNSGYQTPYWGNSCCDYGWDNCWNTCNTGCWNTNYCYYPAQKPAVCASFIQDVTIADGSYVAPGTTFTKTWRIRNNGTVTWNTGYKLVFSSGSQLSGPAAVNLPRNVAPGEMVDISVNLTAPTSSGTFRGYWMLQTDSGQVFGVGSSCNVAVWVAITTAQLNYCGYNNCCWGNWNCAPLPDPGSWNGGNKMTQPAWPTWPSW